MSANLNIRIPEWLDKICVSPLMLYRRLKYGEPFRKIYLGEGEYTIVDPDVYYQKCQYKWIYFGAGKKSYVIREIKIGRNKTKRIYMHREIMKARKGRVVDHRNGEGLDNRGANLRLATYSQNMANRAKTKKRTSSKYIGVSIEKGCKSWRVAIRVNGKQMWLGSFKNEIDAARAYDCAALKYHGEFARLNFPREDYVKVGNHYEYAGTPPAECSGSLGDRITKIYSSILTRFGKQKKRKAGWNYERNTLRQRPVR
jgi:hypothetical protein